MLKKFIKYVSQNMLGMVGMSVYILADTYFISVAVGADGITALNLVLPIYNIIFAIGAMMGVGSAIRFVVERNKKSPDADGYFFHALVWAFIISLFFIFVGLFLPDKLIALLGGDTQIVATGKNYTRIFMCFAPFFMWNYICNAFVRNDGNPSIAMSATLFSSLFNIVFDYIFSSKISESVARTKGIVVEYDIPAPIHVRCDVDMVKTIVRNLLSNAIKYSPEGGGKIIVSTAETPTHAVVRVRDFGVGIKPEDLNKVLDPAMYFTTYGTGKEEGSGLGLQLCLDLVHRNGGEMTVESVYGEGATFSFTIAKSPADERPASAGEPV